MIMSFRATDVILVEQIIIWLIYRIEQRERQITIAWIISCNVNYRRYSTKGGLLLLLLCFSFNFIKTIKFNNIIQTTGIITAKKMPQLSIGTSNLSRYKLLGLAPINLWAI
mgnify:CR=1 FL=1